MNWYRMRWKGRVVGLAAGVMTVCAAVGTSGTAHALAIADAVLHTTGAGWSISTTGTLVLTPIRGEDSGSQAVSKSSMGTSFPDYDFLSGIVDTSATTGIVEARGSNADAASTTAAHALSASSHTESYGEEASYPREGAADAFQRVVFTATGSGDLILTMPYEFSVSVSGTAVSDYAYARAVVNVVANAGHQSYEIFDSINGIGSDSKSLTGTALLTLTLQDGNHGAFWFESFVYTNAHSSPTPVPEPATMLLVGSGLAGLGWFGRKRREDNGA